MMLATPSPNGSTESDALRQAQTVGDVVALTKLLDPKRGAGFVIATLRAIGATVNRWAVPHVVEYLEIDRRPEVRNRGMKTLGALGDPAAIPTLALGLMEDGPCRFGSVEGLEAIGGPKAVEALRLALDHPDSTLRAKAVKALGTIGGEEAIPVLTVALEHDDWSVRVRAQGGALGHRYSCRPRRSGAAAPVRHNPSRPLVASASHRTGKAGSLMRLEDVAFVMEACSRSPSDVGPSPRACLGWGAARRGLARLRIAHVGAPGFVEGPSREAAAEPDRTLTEMACKTKEEPINSVSADPSLAQPIWRVTDPSPFGRSPSSMRYSRASVPHALAPAEVPAGAAPETANWDCPRCGAPWPPWTRAGHARLEWERDDPFVLGDFTWASMTHYPFVRRELARELERFAGFEARKVEVATEAGESPRRMAVPAAFLTEAQELVELWVTEVCEADPSRSTLSERQPACATCGQSFVLWGESETMASIGMKRGRGLVVTEGVEWLELGDWDPVAKRLAVTRHPRKVGQGLFVASGELGGAGFFHVRQLNDGYVFCTDEVKRYIEERGLTNIDFLCAGEVFEGPRATLEADRSAWRGKPTDSNARGVSGAGGDTAARDEGDALPDEPAGLAGREFELPKLTPDSADGCPDRLRALLEYLNLEAAPDVLSEGDLSFERTALIDAVDAWVWSFGSGEYRSYAMVYRSPDGEVERSCLFIPDDCPTQLTPEQALVADRLLGI